MADAPVVPDSRKDHGSDSRRRPVYYIPVVFLFLFLLIQPVCGFVTIEYFHQADCLNCIRTDPIIHDIGGRYGDRVLIRDINIDTRQTVRLLMSYGRTEIPVVVINHVKILDGFEITEERLDKEIRLAESGPYEDYGPGTGTSSESGILAILFSYFLGIMTGLSPCLLGTLVVMIAATASTVDTQKTKRLYAPFFGAGLVTTYLIIAAGVLIAGFRLTTGSGFSTTIYLVIGIATISFGIIQLGLIRFPEMVQVPDHSPVIPVQRP